MGICGKRYLWRTAFAFLLFAICGGAFAGPYGTSRPDRILIQLKPGADDSLIANFLGSHKSKVLGESKALGRIQVIGVPPGTAAEQFISECVQSGLVNYAEPDYLRHLALTTPNDPKLLDGTLWGLNNYGQSGGVPHADISALQAWDVLTAAPGIIVAVVDSGVRYTHEDLAANMWSNPNDNTHGWNALTHSTDPSDGEGHGTLSAGVLGAVGNNGKGVTGVAWQVQIMACACFDATGNASDSDIIGCLDFARTNGARIVNASWGGYAFSQTLSNAVYALRSAGVILVAASGNDFRNIDVSPYYPACYGLDNILSVAYTTRTDALGQFSNFGATNVDLAAPGAAMYSTFFTSDTAYLGGSFLEGTSLAAPMVSGALALLMARYPAETHQQLIARLLAATDPLPSLAGKCITSGRLNLFKALQPPIRLAPLGLSSGIFQLRVSADPNRTCVVQSSTNLVAWLPFTTNTTSISGTFDFSDPSWTNFPARFFRAVSTDQ
jgi:subtilisin family serine protease